MLNFDQFRVRPGTRVLLSRVDPDFPGGKKNGKAEKLFERNLKQLRHLQEVLYAEHKRSLIICLQALDAGGKDGTIRNVFGAMNPQGCRVHSFRAPNLLEADHDFLWRAHAAAPVKGEIAIFNRSHYEDVLVPRVKKLVPPAVWQQRYKQINDFERTLSENSTHILKFYLHIDKDEQLKRFGERLDDPTKQWKVNAQDYEERELWNGYRLAFQDMLGKCSTSHSPWFIIPSNHKWFRNLAVSQIVVDYLKNLNMHYPHPKADIAAIRKKYYR